jgi:redox-sensitive bicupin YhaK (pirin superfamily)
MIIIRKNEERGHFNHGWLETYHTFSFADYHDPQWMGFQALRVINEDWVMPGKGFPEHSHRDMEIITTILEGVVEHKDSMGNVTQIRAGEVQRMTAGTGVTHSEYNPSTTDKLHLLQIWILPEKKGLPPGYEQKKFSGGLIASRDGREGSLTIHQDVNLFRYLPAKGESISVPVSAGRHLWMQVTRGEIKIKNHTLLPGDGAAVSEEKNCLIEAYEPSEFLLFDLNEGGV